MIEHQPLSTFQFLSLFLPLLGFGLVLLQLNRNRQVARANIILTLMERSWRFTAMHHEIQEKHSIGGNDKLKHDARDFLRFLETTMLMVSDDVVSAAELFPSIGYRTFTFMNDSFIREKFLFSVTSAEKQNVRLEEPTARHCGAFALYELLFAHFSEKFDHDAEMALRHYGLVEQDPATGKLVYDRSIFWRESFVKGVTIYYKHKDPASIPDIRMRILDTRRAIEERIARAACAAPD